MQVIGDHEQPFLEYSDEYIILQNKDLTDPFVKITGENAEDW